MIFATSERLVLRRPHEADLEPLLRGREDPAVNLYTGRRADERGFLVQLIADMQDKAPGDAGPGGPWYQFVVERRGDGAVIGDLGAGFGLPGERQVEIGYRILPEYQRRGYAREAAAALIDYLVAEHGIHRIVAVAAAPNEASKALLRSLGFRQEGHFRQSFLCHGEWLDDDYFALLAQEWARQEGFAQRRRPDRL